LAIVTVALFTPSLVGENVMVNVVFSLGAIGDTVWFDKNSDGSQQPGEPGIANVKVILQADFNGDSVVDYTTSMLTDGNGNYGFQVSDNTTWYYVEVFQASPPLAGISIRTLTGA
jgi:hypothetical protein